jgi:2,3-dihydroxy-p-cumate/2,3-dihydroxybenzoate 3,4-dioxygenase
MTGFVDGFGYLVLDTPDLDKAADFYTTFCRFRITERHEDAVFLGLGQRHHWLVLRARETFGTGRLAFRAAAPDSLEGLRGVLEQRAIRFEEVSYPEGEYIGNALRFQDLDGNQIEVFDTMVLLPVPVPPAGVNLLDMQHAVILVKDVIASAAFYQDILRLKVSDWIGRTGCFMRGANGEHHCLGLFKSSDKAGRLDHFDIAAQAIDDVVRMRNLAIEDGVPLRHDLIRHAPSGSISTYVCDPITNGAVEFSWGNEVVAESDAREPRMLPLSPETNDIWSVLPDGRRATKLSNPESVAPQAYAAQER